MKAVTAELVRGLIDFAPTEQARKMGFAEQQLEGTVALYNMLGRNRCAYLADEVGMGKTYVGHRGRRDRTITALGQDRDRVGRIGPGARHPARRGQAPAWPVTALL